MKWRRVLVTFLGVMAIVFGGWTVLRQATAVYMEPPPPSYSALVPLFGLVLGVATVLGVNVYTHRRGRIFLTATTAGALLFLVLLVTWSIAVYQSPLSTPQVSATDVTCHASTRSCSIVLVNTGQAGGRLAGCSFSQPSGDGTLSPDSSVPAGGTLQVTCLLGGTGQPTKGAPAAGNVYLNNGGYSVFTATWT